MALRFASVMRGISKPFVVDLISSNEETFGAVVPMPAEPVAGNVFCACIIPVAKAIIVRDRIIFFITVDFCDAKDEML